MRHTHLPEGYDWEKESHARNDKLGMGKIGTLRDRSPATVKNQLDRHNEAINRVGFCSVCKRAEGQYFRDQATRLL